jgi:hypothetical protein
MFCWYIFLNCACAPIKQVDVLANVFFPIYFLSIRAFSQDCSPNDGIASRARFYSTSLLICFQSCHLGFSAYILRCSVAPAHTSFPTRNSQSATLLLIFITLSFIFFLLVLPSDQRQLLLDLSNVSFVGCFYLLNYPPIAPLCVT